MKRIKENQDFLCHLCKNKNKNKRKNLIENASREEIYTLCEIILNILKGNINISKEDRDKLTKKKKYSKKNSRKNKFKKEKIFITARRFFRNINSLYCIWTSIYNF